MQSKPSNMDNGKMMNNQDLNTLICMNFEDRNQDWWDRN